MAVAATFAKRTEIIRNEIRDYHRHTRERAVVKGEERDSKVVPTIPRARSCGTPSGGPFGHFGPRKRQGKAERLAKRCFHGAMEHPRPSVNSGNSFDPTKPLKGSALGRPETQNRTPPLRALSKDLALCSEVTDAGVKVLAEKCPGLESVDLAYCSKVTDAGGKCPSGEVPGPQVVETGGLAQKYPGFELSC